MKRLGKSSKKGFTLVELIVVLVILAVLAAMLVPALTGYIKKAKEEKEFQTASTIYTAVQALSTEAYGKGKTSKTDVEAIVTKDKILELAGVDAAKVNSITYFRQEATNTKIGVIEAISIEFTANTGVYYNYVAGDGTWVTSSSVVSLPSGVTAVKYEIKST